MFETQSPETRQDMERQISIFEHMQVPNRTGSDVRRSKRSTLVADAPCRLIFSEVELDNLLTTVTYFANTCFTTLLEINK